MVCITHWSSLFIVNISSPCAYPALLQVIQQNSLELAEAIRELEASTAALNHTYDSVSHSSLHCSSGYATMDSTPTGSDDTIASGGGSSVVAWLWLWEELVSCGLFVGCLKSQQHASVWLLNVPATCKYISGMDLLRQFYVLPHWDRSCRSNFPPHLITVYWHWTNQSQHWPYNTRRLAG